VSIDTGAERRQWPRTKEHEEKTIMKMTTINPEPGRLWIEMGLMPEKRDAESSEMVFARVWIAGWAEDGRPVAFGGRGQLVEPEDAAQEEFPGHQVQTQPRTGWAVERWHSADTDPSIEPRMVDA